MLIVYAICLVIQLTKGEMYKALAEMEVLFHTEAVLADSLQQYILATEEKLKTLKKHVEQYSKGQRESAADVQKYLSNPINMYLLTRRLTKWRQIETVVLNDMGRAIVVNIRKQIMDKVLRFPTDEDVNGVMEGLLRIQDTFNLKTSAIASGGIHGVQTVSEFTASDCFELGKQAEIVGDYRLASSWMTEAINRYNREVDTAISKSEVLEYLAYSYYMSGNTSMAVEVTQEQLKQYSDDEKAKANLAFYETEMSSGKAQENEEVAFSVHGRVKQGKDIIDKGCRGELEINNMVRRKLKCRYVDNKPFLKLARLKEEDAFVKPNILIYHDVLSDKEIEILKTITQPKFSKAKPEESDNLNPDFGVSQSSWTYDFEHPNMVLLNRRIEDVTSLSVASSEPLKVINYGIGGHEDPQYDISLVRQPNEYELLGFGERIATLLIHMSDVPHGGATVFPELSVTLVPKKGSAVLWFNTYSTGTGNIKMQYASCPVFIGNKWVAKKWFHERGQEFTQPCGLVEGEYAPP